MCHEVATARIVTLRQCVQRSPPPLELAVPPLENAVICVPWLKLFQTQGIVRRSVVVVTRVPFAACDSNSGLQATAKSVTMSSRTSCRILEHAQCGLIRLAAALVARSSGTCQSIGWLFATRGLISPRVLLTNGPDVVSAAQVQG